MTTLRIWTRAAATMCACFAMSAPVAAQTGNAEEAVTPPEAQSTPAPKPEAPAPKPGFFQRLLNFGNPSPTAGSETSQKANAAADEAAYKPVEYANKETKGPALVVIPGQIRSNNASFMQRFLPNNIADFAEIELSAANFPVLERSDLGSLLEEITLAYNLGDAQKARTTMSVGKLKTTEWIVKFDIIKAEQIAENQQGFDGRAIGGIIGSFGGTGSLVAGRAVSSVKTDESSGVWLIGMRYRIMNASTTEQVAQGYNELKMEVGSKGTSVLGVSQSAKGGVGLDTMIQRLVQTSVYEIDSQYK